MKKEISILILIIVTSASSQDAADADADVGADDVGADTKEVPTEEVGEMRLKRQAGTEDNCQFNVRQDVVNNCSYVVQPNKLNYTGWKLGVATGFNWIGGPERDGSDSANGGFAFASMSDLTRIGLNDTAWMLTVPRSSTGEDGRCLKFKYAINGLNTKQFTVYLLNYHDESVTPDDLTTFLAPPPEEQDANTTEEMDKIIKFDLNTLIDIRQGTDGDWIDAKASFSSNSLHSIAFVARANVHLPLFRGYVAVDNVVFTSGPCDNDCAFDRDYCEWINADQQGFGWSLARSTRKRGTGPTRDQSSSLNEKLMTGGYTYIDSDYPRQSGDVAKLTSDDIIAEDSPFCLTFWVHMYGGGIGQLRVLRQIRDEDPKVLWRKSGSSNLDRWNPSQLTVTAEPGTNFKVVFEATVGETGFGDIALDTVKFEDGPCPHIPPTSAVGASIGDCTFLINACEWKLWQPSTLTTSPTPMLTLSTGSYTTVDGKTQIPYSGVDYYMKYEMGFYKHRVRDSAFLISPTIQNSGEGVCLSFWVYMYTTVPTEVKIGSLTVIVVTSDANTTIWKLENKQHAGWEHAQVAIRETRPFQVYIQGTKGTKMNGMIGVDDIAFFHSNCTLEPPEAQVSPDDCAFNSDPCTWKVETLDSVTPRADSKSTWRYAGIGQSINVLTDHTFGIENSGFMYMEAFNSDIVSRLVSPTIESGVGEIEGEICLGFFFATFYSDNTAELSVFSRNADGVVISLWKVTQANLPPRPEGNVEVEWNFGRVAVTIPSQVVIEGKIRNAGWAVDDIKFTNGTCETYPEAATPTTTPINPNL